MTEFRNIINENADTTKAIDKIYPTKETLANIKSKLANEGKLDMFFDDRFDFEIPEEIKNSIIEALKEKINSEESVSPFTFQCGDEYFGLEFLCNKDESVGVSIKSRDKNKLINFLNTYSKI
jgi:hypothetical protein